MANAWSTPHQQDYVPPAPDNSDPAGWQQNLGTSAAMQNCFCPMCSRNRDTNHDMTGSTIVYQDPSPLVESVDPYANQNVGGAYPASITGVVGHPAQAWSAAPQAPQYQANARYTPLNEIVDPPRVQMGTVPNQGVPGLLATERLRRLARRYVNNPDSTVNGVYSEPGPSGRFQVVITIDIGDILGDTNN